MSRCSYSVLSFALAAWLLPACAAHKPQLQVAQLTPPLFLHLLFGDELSASARVPLSKPFATGTLNGLIQPRAEKYYAKIKGSIEGTGNFFEGELELEKPVLPTLLAFQGFCCVGEFVLSTNSDFPTRSFGMR